MSPQTNRRLRYLGVAAVIVALLWFLTGLCIGAFHQSHASDSRFVVQSSVEMLEQMTALLAATADRSDPIQQKVNAKGKEMLPALVRLGAAAERADRNPVNFVAAYRYNRARDEVERLHDDFKALHDLALAGRNHARNR